MAYTKRTWLGRQGTGLNKFSIGGATPVTIVNQPDSVTQVGDALSAGNLNDLEDRIEDAFDDVDTELATKADEQDVTNLNNAISQLDHRLDNLEQSKGDYIVSAYKDGSTTPSGKGKWAVVEGLRGVSRVENNVQYNGNFASADGWVNGTVSDGHIEGSANAGAYWQPFNNTNKPTIIQGHVYLIRAKLKAVSGLASGTTTYNLRINGTSSTNNAVSMLSTSIPNGTSVMLEGIHTANASTSGTGVTLFWGVHNDTNNFTAQWEGLVLTDLTLYFGGTIPSDADTIAEIQQNYPHLLIPSDYGVRIVDSSYSGVRAWSPNVVDEDVLLTSEYASKSGEEFTLNTIGLVKSDFAGNKIWTGFKPNTQYTFSWTGRNGTASNVRLLAVYTDGTSSNLAIISSTSDTLATGTSSSSKTIDYVGLDYGSNGTFYFKELMVNEGTTALSYKPYGIIDTLSLTFSGKSAGSVYDSCEPNVEVGGVARRRETRKVSSYVFDGVTDVISSSTEWQTNCYSFRISPTKTEELDPVASANALASGYIYSTSPHNNVGSFMLYKNSSGLVIYINHDNNTMGMTAFLAYLQNNPITFHFTRETPVVTLSDPIIDNTLLTESGGRLSTVQTGTVVDGISDLGFITL